MIAATLAITFVPVIASAANTPKHSIRISNNSITLDGKPGRIAYKSAGDLDRDGRIETVFSMMYKYAAFDTVVARLEKSGWSVVTVESSAYCFSKTDAADVNGDGRMELVVRTMSGDGHSICFIYHLKAGKLLELPSDDRFGLTRFIGLDHDGRLELLSISCPSTSFLGDFWLNIYKWNGRRYVDVSNRFPAQYESVIRRINRMIYRLRYTSYYGHPQTPKGNPVFADLYYYLGQAYELRRQPDKARTQYAIAYRLNPKENYITNAFRRTWKSQISRSFD